MANAGDRYNNFLPSIAIQQQRFANPLAGLASCRLAAGQRQKMAKDSPSSRSLFQWFLKIGGVLDGIAVLVIAWQEYSELNRVLKIGVIAVVEPITSFTE